MKAFNVWSMEGIEVRDPGLQRYVSLAPRIVPRSGGRYAADRFHKSKAFIVERLVNKLMNAGHKGKKHWRTSSHQTGKGLAAYRIVKDALKKIEAKTKENPIKVFIQALENAAPREEIVTIEYGGARYPKAVDCAPQRRIDVALRLFTQGAFQRCFNAKVAVADALTDEILAAYKMDQKSNAIAKKLELERQADASR